MPVQFGNVYVTRQPIDGAQFRTLKNRFHPHQMRGSIALYAEPQSRAVVVTPFNPTTDAHAEDKFIRQVLREEQLPFEAIF